MIRMGVFWRGSEAGGGGLWRADLFPKISLKFGQVPFCRHIRIDMIAQLKGEIRVSAQKQKE